MCAQVNKIFTVFSEVTCLRRAIPSPILVLELPGWKDPASQPLQKSRSYRRLMVLYLCSNCNICCGLSNLNKWMPHLQSLLAADQCFFFFRVMGVPLGKMNSGDRAAPLQCFKPFLIIEISFCYQKQTAVLRDISLIRSRFAQSMLWLLSLMFRTRPYLRGFEGCKNMS